MLQLNIQPHAELLHVEVAPINAQFATYFMACSVVKFCLADIFFSSFDMNSKLPSSSPIVTAAPAEQQEQHDYDNDKRCSTHGNFLLFGHQSITSNLPYNLQSLVSVA